MIYVFDIDGVLADITHRLHLIPKEPKGDWTPFYAAAKDDKPILPMLDLMQQLTIADDDLFGARPQVFCLTSRPEFTRSDTNRWLASLCAERLPENIDIEELNKQSVGRLFMRDTKPGEEGTQSAADEARYKLGVLDKLCAENGLAPAETVVFEDRLRVAKHLRDAGYTVLMPQVNDY